MHTQSYVQDWIALHGMTWHDTQMKMVFSSYLFLFRSSFLPFFPFNPLMMVHWTPKANGSKAMCYSKRRQNQIPFSSDVKANRHTISISMLWRPNDTWEINGFSISIAPNECSLFFWYVDTMCINTIYTILTTYLPWCIYGWCQIRNEWSISNEPLSHI